MLLKKLLTHKRGMINDLDFTKSLGGRWGGELPYLLRVLITKRHYFQLS